MPLLGEPQSQASPAIVDRGPATPRPLKVCLPTRSAPKPDDRASPRPRPIMLVDDVSPAVRRDDGRPEMTNDADVGRRIDAVHQQVQLHLERTCPTEEPLVVICALGYEIVRRIHLLERVWTPKALDRFLTDFTRVLRRHVLDRRML